MFWQGPAIGCRSNWLSRRSGPGLLRAFTLVDMQLFQFQLQLFYLLYQFFGLATEQHSPQFIDQQGQSLDLL